MCILSFSLAVTILSAPAECLLFFISDIDECALQASNPCTQRCENTAGSFRCVCDVSGYTQADDGVSCVGEHLCVSAVAEVCNLVFYAQSTSAVISAVAQNGQLYIQHYCSELVHFSDSQMKNCSLVYNSHCLQHFWRVGRRMKNDAGNPCQFQMSLQTFCFAEVNDQMLTRVINPSARLGSLRVSVLPAVILVPLLCSLPATANCSNTVCDTDNGGCSLENGTETCFCNAGYTLSDDNTTCTFIGKPVCGFVSAILAMLSLMMAVLHPRS